LLLENKLQSWQASENPKCRLSTSVAFKSRSAQPSPPSKTQAITYMGYRGIDRKDPRYYSALVESDFGRRYVIKSAGTEIRDRLGFYGIYSSFQAGRHSGPF